MNLLAECAGAKTIGISAHIRPDGDAVGSTMALYLYLKKALPDVTVKLFLENPPASMNHLKYINEVDTSFCWDGTFDVYFALDCNLDRLGEAAKFYTAAGKRINIDHHVSNINGCGDVNDVRPDAGSASEVLYTLLEKQYIDEDIAMAIYTGIIHDTGVFQYSCTTPETLRIAAELIGYGFDFSKLVQESFYQKSYLQNQILGRALMESIVFMDGHCIFTCVDRKMMDFYGIIPADLDGIVNQLRNTKGVDVAIFMYQTGVLEYKVSMRSSEKVDVSRVATFFGGGGHIRAAGVTMTGTMHDVINNLSLQIENQLKEKKND